MAEVSEARLRVWTYRWLMGTLGVKKRELLKNMLATKERRGELEPLERRLWMAMRLHYDHSDQRNFVKKELKAWEKRTAP